MSLMKYSIKHFDDYFFQCKVHFHSRHHIEEAVCMEFLAPQ